jgi:glucosylceramidase
MKRLTICIIAACAFFVSCSGPAAKKISFYVTTGGETRAAKNGLVKTAPDSAKVQFTVDETSPKQTVSGFGGAFNEQGWVALKSLDETERAKVLRAIFAPEEANLAWGRIPIGASDYALDRYTLAPVAGDFGMQHFTLDRDRKDLIPYVKASLAIRPDLKLWASAWTPPVWMKDNNDYEAGNFIDKDEYYKAYALYLEKFVEEYGKEGIAVSAVAVQNEPTVVTGYPNGGWKPQQFLKFIRDFGGPLFAQNKVPAALWLATFNDGDYSTFAKTVLDDPEAKKYVGAVGLQWDGDKQLPQLKKDHPDIPVIQTETDCGNLHWKPGFNKDRAANDFAYAYYTWGRMRDYFAAGAEAYMLWNIVLDQDGKNIDKKLPWPQNSAVVIDTGTKKVTWTPMFRAFEHYSRYIPVGSKVLTTTGPMKDAIAFKTPSGAIVVELMNSGIAKKTVTGRVAGKTLAVELPAGSFATLIVEPDAP